MKLLAKLDDRSQADRARDEAVDRLATSIYSLAYRHLGSRADAEAITTRVLVQEMRSRHSSVDEEARNARLVATARSAIVDVWRSHGAKDAVSRGWSIEEKDRPDEPLGGIDRSYVRRLLNRLEPVERRVVELRLLEGRSVSETSKALGIDDTTTKLLLSRTLRRATELAGT